MFGSSMVCCLHLESGEVIVSSGSKEKDSLGVVVVWE